MISLFSFLSFFALVGGFL
uniref:Uncharacterized protein n=1 Tax=Rhizophora mucronata TaxID=61149 RepID=A0A2P2IU62_RHIMU